MLRLLIVALAAPLCASAQSVLESAKKDDIIIMADQEPAMRKAFERARETLDEFLAKAKSPAPGTAYYAVKVAVRDGRNTEYFWVGPFSQELGGFSGVIDNTPRLVKTVRERQVYLFPKSHIVDWAYVDEQQRRMFGNFTMCALLTKESPAEAERAKKTFGLKCE